MLRLFLFALCTQLINLFSGKAPHLLNTRSTDSTRAVAIKSGCRASSTTMPKKGRILGWLARLKIRHARRKASMTAAFSSAESSAHLREGGDIVAEQAQRDWAAARSPGMLPMLAPSPLTLPPTTWRRNISGKKTRNCWPLTQPEPLLRARVEFRVKLRAHEERVVVSASRHWHCSSTISNDAGALDGSCCVHWIDRFSWAALKKIST
eukprot:COSAG02_NODE_3217_length_7156_cov_5.216381_4_plen_208_part_00